MSGGRVAGEPDRLEAYTDATQAVLGPTRNSLDDYTVAVRAFLSAEPNDFGTAGVADHTGQMNAILDGLAELDAKPAAFAFALRQLDRSAARALSATDTELFDALTQARIAMPLAAPEDVYRHAVGVLAAVSGESSLAILLAHFDRFDVAAEGGDLDGRISQADLEAIRDDGSLPQDLRVAARHLLDSPTLRKLATGGGAYLTRESISEFIEMNRRLRTVDQHFPLLDTAAEGGDPDGFVSLGDLEAAAGDLSLPADAREAARWLLDHPEQLRLLRAYSQIKELGGAPAPIPYTPGGFSRQDLIGRVIDGQVYGDDPEAAKRFVNSLPVADDGRPGLPIWLVSTDGFKALANAALTAAGGDLTEYHSVIAHLPETKDAIRNELITAYYSMMAGRVEGILAGGQAGDPAAPGHPGANWFTYGQWASDGVHDVINGNLNVLLSIDDRQHAADGNQWIFNDVGGRFAAFVELHEKNGNNPSAAQLEAFLRDNFGDGDRELRTGFTAYLAAMREPDPVRRQALAFQANILLTAHEQAGVQPYVEGIGKPLVPDEWEAAWANLRIGDQLLDLDRDIPPRAGANNHIAGMRLLDLDVGGKRPDDFSQPGLMLAPDTGPAAPGAIRLGDLSGIEGFSPSSATWHREGAETFVTAIPLLLDKKVLADPDGLAGSGATAWTDYNERMWTILKLYEQTHTDPTIFPGPSGRSFGAYDWLEPGARPPR